MRCFQSVLLLTFLTGCGDEGAPPSTPQKHSPQTESVPPRVSVNGACEIAFPIQDPESLFQWGIGKPNVAEYFWQADIQQAKAHYQIGFSYFNPNARPQSGTLRQLLDVGQSDVWLVDDSLNALRCGVQVDLTLSEGVVTLRISDPKAVHELFIEHPERISYKIGGTQMRYTTGDVPVHYAKPPSESQITK